MWEGPFHYGLCHPRASGLGWYKKANWTGHEEQASKQHPPWLLLQFLALNSHRLWPINQINPFFPGFVQCLSLQHESKLGLVMITFILFFFLLRFCLKYMAFCFWKVCLIFQTEYHSCLLVTAFLNTFSSRLSFFSPWSRFGHNEFLTQILKCVQPGTFIYIVAFFLKTILLQRY